MEYRVLGKTGLKVSRLGFGGIPIQRIDAEGTKALMHRLLEAGVNYIDSARGYTVSEEYIGYGLEGIRDKFILATKGRGLTKQAMQKDLETITAPGGALEALRDAKAAGTVRHIGITAHSTQVFEKALDMDWVETIMFPYNLVENQGAELIAKCQEKNVGFICMKPLAGGAIDDASLALRYIVQNPAVTVVIPGMASDRELSQNLAAVGNSAPLTGEETAKIQAIRDSLGTQFCRRCNYCAPCTVGIHIPQLFVLEGYLTRYGLADWAKGRYEAETKASTCIECGACEGRCPYHLPIREMMKRVAREFEG